MISQRLTDIVKDILNNEIFFAKMSIDNGVPKLLSVQPQIEYIKFTF